MYSHSVNTGKVHPERVSTATSTLPHILQHVQLQLQTRVVQEAALLRGRTHKASIHHAEASSKCSAILIPPSSSVSHSEIPNELVSEDVPQFDLAALFSTSSMDDLPPALKEHALQQSRHNLDHLLHLLRPSEGHSEEGQPWFLAGLPSTNLIVALLRFQQWHAPL